jgi:hypothetical protein
MRNSGIAGTSELATPLRFVAKRLPPTWRLEAQPKAATVTLRAPDGTAVRLSVLRKKKLEPRDVKMLQNSSQRDLGRTLVTAEFLSPRTRQLLSEAGASYADASGNLRVVVDRPGIFLEAEGAQRDPEREPRPLASLKGPAAARVVRALCDFRPPYGVRKLAEIAETAPASASRVVTLLEKEALIERGPRDEIRGVDWPGLLQRWVQDYQFLSSNDVTTYLDPRGLQSFPAKLGNLKARVAVTGSLAAVRRAPVASPRLAAVYVADPESTAKALDLRSAESGGNVTLACPLDPVVFARSWVEEGIRYAALSQVAADLFTSPGRGPSEAEELIAWMKKNTDAWRA